tara:strand:- start:568 stop:951 length:384 start_codon:yes stop_codon:yes gene_type:complete
MNKKIIYESTSLPMDNTILKKVETIFNKFITCQYGNNYSNEPRKMFYSERLKTLWLADPIQMTHFGSAADGGSCEGILLGVQWFGNDKIITWFECPESGDITHHYRLLRDGNYLCIDGFQLPEIHCI